MTDRADPPRPRRGRRPACRSTRSLPDVTRPQARPRRAAPTTRSMDFDLLGISLDLDIRPSARPRRAGRRRRCRQHRRARLSSPDDGDDADPLVAQARAGRGVPPDRRHGRRARPAAAKCVAKASGALEDQGAGHARRPEPDAASPDAPSRVTVVRVALGIAYRGQRLPAAGRASPTAARSRTSSKRRLAASPTVPSRTVCAGRTDAGVHALNQVVHLDTDVERDAVLLGARHQPLPARRHRGAVVPARARRDFHARNSAIGRRYAYVLLESPVRPALEAGHRRLDLPPARRRRHARRAAQRCSATHDFSAFRSSECQAPSPVKTLRAIDDQPARRLLALRLRRRAPSCTTWCATSWAAWSRSAAAAARPAWLGRGAGRARPQRSPRRPSRPTACTSVGPYYDARPCHPERHRRRWTGCP